MKLLKNPQFNSKTVQNFGSFVTTYKRAYTHLCFVRQDLKGREDMNVHILAVRQVDAAIDEMIQWLGHTKARVLAERIERSIEPMFGIKRD